MPKVQAEKQPLIFDTAVETASSDELVSDLCRNTSHHQVDWVRTQLLTRLARTLLMSGMKLDQEQILFKLRIASTRGTSAIGDCVQSFSATVFRVSSASRPLA